MELRGIASIASIVLTTQAASQMTPWNVDMYEALPRAEEVEKATTVNELRYYLTREAVQVLQWMAMLRIAEIGGEEAADALCEFYQQTEGIDAIDAGTQPKAGALILLGRVGGERAKNQLLEILGSIVRAGPAETHTRPRLSPLGHQLLRAAVEGLTAYWQDQSVYDRLYSLSWNPPELLTSGDSRWAEAGLLRIDMRRAGVVTLPLEEQVRFLLERVRSPGFGGSTIVGQGRWTHDAVVTEAIDRILCDDFGSEILPLVEKYASENDSLLDSKAKDGLTQLMGSLRTLPQWEGLRRQEIERARESLSRPGTRLVVKQDSRGKWIEAVPVDSTGAGP